MIKHLMFKGKNVTIPLCGNTEIGKIVTFTLNSANCLECMEVLTSLKSKENYIDAVNMVSIYSTKDNLDKHLTNSEDIHKAVLGDKSEFWVNIKKFSS